MIAADDTVFDEAADGFSSALPACTPVLWGLGNCAMCCFGATGTPAQ